MTRTIRCDVCGIDRDISNADDYFVLQIPHRNLEEEIDEPLVVDICSLECLGTVVESLGPDAPQVQTVEAPPSRVEGVPHGRLRPKNRLTTDDIVDDGPHFRYEGEVEVR
jgi:hypothetical protein